MRDMELEEGEAYFFHDNNNDDDENIDPDRDFSYIDKKIENVLGHYQKDFMGGLSAESLGARFGGYGSFLPMHQRSPSVLPEQRTQSHGYIQSCPNTTGAASLSLPMKPLTVSNAKGTQAVSESGALPINNQVKHQVASDSASNKQQKEPVPQYSRQNSLKLRVKMTAENALPYDKSALYSGLGLDVSPSSSSSDSHSDSDDGVQVKTESPSYIVEIMTTLPLSNEELLSPLHDSLVLLPLKEKNEETYVPGYSQTLVANKSSENNCSEGKKEASHGRRSSKGKESSKDRKIKKELRKERKLKEAQQSMTGNTTVLSINGKDSVSVGAVSAVNIPSENREVTGSKPSMYDKTAVRSSEDNFGSSKQQLPEARETVNGLSASASSNAAAVEDVNSLSGRTRVNKADISVSQGELIVEKKKAADETYKFQKQEGSMKDKVKEKVLGTVGPKQEKVHRKGYEMTETTSTDKDENDGTYEDMKDFSTPKLSKPKACIKVTPHSQVEAGVLSGKKKSREEQPRESSVVGPSSAPSKSKKGDSDTRKEIKKDHKAGSTNAGPNKKVKETSLKDFEMGVPEREMPLFPKEKPSFKRKDIGVPNIASVVGGNGVGNMPVVNSAPTEIVPHDDWVQCDKCHKWRLLPLGMDPESLPKVWKCSMLTWLPGKNKCSVSEEETNAVYQPVGPTLLQNNQLAYPDVAPFVGPTGGIPHVGISGQTSNFDSVASGSKRPELVKTELDAAGGSVFQDRVPVKKEQLHSSEFGSRNPKKISRDLNTARKSGDVKPSKPERKREADFEASGISKKMKRAHHHSIGNPNPISQPTIVPKVEDENYDIGPLEAGQDYGKRPLKSSHLKVKDRALNSTIPHNIEVKDSGKKRKLKDQAESTTSLEMKNSVSGKNSDSELREQRKERKLKSSNLTNSRTHSDGGKHNMDISSDDSRRKRGKRDSVPFEGGHADKGSHRMANVRSSSEKAVDLGLSDNGTTSSSSKVSSKRKAKASEVKSSPIGSISSSPFRLSKCDSDKGTSKMPVSYKESVELSSSKQPKLRAEGALNEWDRKSNLCKSSGVDKSAGKRPSVHITEDCKDSSYEQATNVDNGSLRHAQTNAQSSDIESPLKKGNLLRAAKAALKEATNLKHSANRLKISGSTIESTEVFFQAALKFLHGASLLEPENNESGRSGEMASSDVYSTTATLCEYCAREYERGDNLASAVLAYKCMEVAFMRVVYCNDLIASRDRTELQMTIRTAPQVESPSSSASDVDNLNHQAVTDITKDSHSASDHRAHVISAENRPSFIRLLNFTGDINRAMEASRRSQIAFKAASPILAQAGKHAVISSIKTVLDFSFHDIEGFLHLVRLAMEALGST